MTPSALTYVKTNTTHTLKINKLFKNVLKFLKLRKLLLEVASYG